MTPAQSLLRQATGLSLSRPLVQRAVDQRRGVTGHASEQAYLDAITPAELAELVELLVVPESWFFRDPQAFKATLEFVRAHTGSRPVHILSIPCAGGEEPYTIAMVLSDAGLPPPNYQIEAWDISAACIARASEGVYGRNAFRGKDMDFRERHFTPIGNEEYRIDDALRRQVRFKQGNLLDLDSGARPGYFDIIFCRNLLIYFDKSTGKAAIERLRTLLADDGLLFAGYAEVPSFCRHGFSPLHYPQAFGLRKARGAGHKAAPPPAAVLPPPVPTARAPRPPHPAAGSNAGSAAATATPYAALTSASAPAQLLAQARRMADQGRNDEAAQACQQCLALAPDQAEAYFILGLLSEHAGEPEQATEHWRRCLYLQPDHYEALCHLALLADQRGNASSAAVLRARAARIYQRQSGKTPEDRDA